jgi:DNA-binding transcriptional MerR regulator
MTDERGQEHGVNENVKDTGRLTITEAATLLGVHPNTVRGRVKAGTYEAEKVFTENGFTWMIDRNSLINPTLPSASQKDPSQAVNPVNPETTTPIELVQDLLRPFVEDLGRVREELGAERVLREQAERERDELRKRLESLQEMRDALETGAEPVEGTTDTPPNRGQAETGVQRRSWLYRVFFGP